MMSLQHIFSCTSWITLRAVSILNRHIFSSTKHYTTAVKYSTLDRLAKIYSSQFDVSVSDDGDHALVTFPGLSIDDVNRAEKVGVWRVVGWMMSVRQAAFNKPNAKTGRTFLEFNKLKNILNFLVSSDTTVSKELYESLVIGKFPESEFELCLGYVGVSSINTVATLVTKETRSVLARNVVQMVTVDTTTRKPTPMPDWWRKEYLTSTIENKKLVVPHQEVPRENASCYNMKVLWNDIDAYKHTSYIAYVQFCFDAAMDAVTKHKYTSFQKDILKYNVKSIQSSYTGECVAGDILNVESWQDPTNPFLLHFSIHKDNNVLFQSHIEFYTNE